MKKLFISEKLYTQVEHFCRYLFVNCLEVLQSEDIESFSLWKPVCVVYNRFTNDYSALALYIDGKSALGKGEYLIRLGIHYDNHTLLLPSIGLNELPLDEKHFMRQFEQVMYNISLGKRYLSNESDNKVDVLSFLDSQNDLGYIFTANNPFRYQKAFDCNYDERWLKMLGIKYFHLIQHTVLRLLEHFESLSSKLEIMEMWSPTGHSVWTMLSTLYNGMVIGLRIRYDGAPGGGFCPICKAPDGTFIQMDTTTWRSLLKKGHKKYLSCLTEYFVYLLAISHKKIEGVWPLEAYDETELKGGFMGRVEFI